jgi:serine/threonine protein kinase
VVSGQLAVGAELCVQADTAEAVEELIHEAAVMAQVSTHPNLVSLVGVVTSGSPKMLLLSFCELGSLLGFLRAKADACTGVGSGISHQERLRIAADIAKGMEHLTAHRFIHRDLAARNVLMGSAGECKVADFGLSRTGAISGGGGGGDGDGNDGADMYYKSSRGVFPVRWSAPESMETMRFSQASDVWSFGITMLEVWSDGAKPYAELDNPTVILRVQAGYRSPKPQHCTAEVFKLMLSCWTIAPEERPPFSDLVVSLEALRQQGLGGGVDTLPDHSDQHVADDGEASYGGLLTSEGGGLQLELHQVDKEVGAASPLTVDFDAGGSDDALAVREAPTAQTGSVDGAKHAKFNNQVLKLYTI